MGLFFVSHFSLPTGHSAKWAEYSLNKAVLKNVAFCFLYLTQNENENASHNTAAPAKKKGMKKSVI